MSFGNTGQEGCKGVGNLKCSKARSGIDMGEGGSKGKRSNRVRFMLSPEHGLGDKKSKCTNINTSEEGEFDIVLIPSNFL